MTISAPVLIRMFLLTGLLVLMPMQILSSGVSYNTAWANSSGGKGNGKSQGQSPAGSTAGTSSAAAGKAGVASNRGRFKSLNASAKAFGRASLNSAVGRMTQYSAALSAFATIDATDDPTVQELAAILAKVANKGELTSENIDWIHQLLLSKQMTTQTTLDEAASILAPPVDPTADPSAIATATPTLADLLAEQTILMQESEPNQVLGPIY